MRCGFQFGRCSQSSPIFERVVRPAKRAAVQFTLRRTIVAATTSAAPAVRASGRPAGHPVLAFVAADQASDLVGRPGSAGRLGRRPTDESVANSQPT
jgi:hypothetical protein